VKQTKAQISIWTCTISCNTRQTWSCCKLHNFINLHTKCGLHSIPATSVHSSWTSIVSNRLSQQNSYRRGDFASV